MTEEGKNKLAFQNHHKQLPAPYIIYADFLTTKVEGPELDPTKSNTRKTQQHEACSYCYIMVRCDGQTEVPVGYPGPNAVVLSIEPLGTSFNEILIKIQNVSSTKMDLKI